MSILSIFLSRRNKCFNAGIIVANCDKKKTSYNSVKKESIEEEGKNNGIFLEIYLELKLTSLKRR